MSPWAVLALATIICCTWMTTGDQVPCQDQLSSADSYQKIKFSLVNKKNQTGHWGTQFRLDKESSSKSRNWKMDFELSNRDQAGVYNFHLLGTMTAPPPLPADYELFPGVGYYKFHYDKKYTFTEAAFTCAKEGGHLVIINSMEENRSIQTLYSKFKANATGGSYIGYYDPNRNRNFVTVFGEHVNSTGFQNWKSGQPDKKEKGQFCVYTWPDGEWADEDCTVRYSFFCEYDLSWIEL